MSSTSLWMGRGSYISLKVRTFLDTDSNKDLLLHAVWEKDKGPERLKSISVIIFIWSYFFVCWVYTALPPRIGFMKRQRRRRRGRRHHPWDSFRVEELLVKATEEARGVSQEGCRDSKPQWCWPLPQLTQWSHYCVFERPVSLFFFLLTLAASDFPQDDKGNPPHGALNGPHGAMTSNPKLSLWAAEIHDNMDEKMGKIIFIEKTVTFKKEVSVGDNEWNEKPAFCQRELQSKQSLF